MSDEYVEIEEKTKDLRIGETKTMNSGQKATIIVYRDYMDVDVQFEDGTVVQHIRKRRFDRGVLKNPNFNVTINKFAKCVGETRTMNNGMKATIIAYRKAKDIDIQFEDGTVVEHKRKSDFDRGVIGYSLSDDDGCLGEVRLMECGQKATCIAYRNKSDIDVQFEDGTIVRHKSKRTFYDNKIKHNICGLNGLLYIGKTNIMKNGQKATIIAYRNCNDIDIQFEDGTVVQHKSKKSFFKGTIKSINYGINASRYVGKTNRMSNGQMATIIAYRVAGDIDVQFEDGTIVEHRNKVSFEKGFIMNPNFWSNKLVGEKKMMNCGMRATIIAYKKNFDIDVRFEDGTVVRHTSKQNFVSGIINNPNLFLNKHIGESKMMNCGMKATIIAYRKHDDIDVQFEDGTIVQHQTYRHFSLGQIKNPNYNVEKIGEKIINYEVRK